MLMLLILRASSLVVIKCAAVFRSTVELGDLTKHRKLVRKSAEEIAYMLKAPRAKILEVRLGSSDTRRQYNSDPLSFLVSDPTQEDGEDCSDGQEWTCYPQCLRTIDKKAS